jgi:anti-sigma B factor antagonist
VSHASTDTENPMSETTSLLRIDRNGTVTCVGFTQSSIIDEVVIQRIGKELLSQVDAAASPRLAIDFTGVEHLSSAALGVLISVHNRIKAQEGQLRLCGIAKPIFEVFKITRLDRLFQTCGTLDEAVRAIA